MLNEKHPDVPKYKIEFDNIVDKMSQELDEAHKKLRECNYKGFDDPYTNSINRKYIKQIKDLKKKYSYLFID